MSSTFDYVLQAPWKRFINHVLHATPRAMERLQGFAGKTVVFRSGLFKLSLTVLANGEVDVAPQGAAADVTMVVSPALLPRLAAKEEAAFKEAAFEGDVDFAQEIGFLARNLKWDIEEDLSKVVGDIVAHRIVSAARAADEWRRDATRRLGENVKEYLTEERPALVARRDSDEFVREVDAARDDVARLEKRLKRLERPSK
jgi:ubiquinone biosynthesis accessory factor UbiJ